MNEFNEIISTYNQYITNIAPGSLKIAEHLRKDEIQQALHLILKFSEGMDWILQVNRILKDNNFTTSLSIEQVQNYLHEINTGLEKLDYVLVADMFEYEIAPFASELRELKELEH